MPSLSDKQILIIDDAPDVRLLVKRVLEGDGARVNEAETVAEGIRIAKSEAPHLIITDLSMPLKSGFEFLAFRNSEPTIRNVPTLVLSGKNDNESVAKAASLGATAYILKPFRASILLQKVRKALKISSFLIKKVPAGQGQAILSLQAEIVRLNEIGCQLESPVKLPPDESVQLSSDLFSDLDLSMVTFRSIDGLGHYAGAGRYLGEISFVGIDRETAKKIRDKIGTLK